MLRRPRRSSIFPADFLLRLSLVCLVCLSILPTPLNAAATIVSAASISADDGLGEDHLPGKYATVAKARTTPFVMSSRPGKQDWHAGHDGADLPIRVLYTFTVADHAAASPDVGICGIVVAAGPKLGARAPPA